jgi:hypothetical protein
MPNKVAIIFMATGPYVRFVRPLVDSLHANFLQGAEKAIYVLSEDNGLSDRVRRMTVLPSCHVGWPWSTLYRYHEILKWANFLEEQRFDYLYHLDADMLVNKPVSEELYGRIVGTISPVGWDWRPEDRPYCRDERSMAYVAFGQEGPHYYTGSLNGGESGPYLDMLREMTAAIDIDLSKRLPIPIHHEESYLNRHYIDHPPEVTLSPEYCCPSHATLEPDWHQRLILTLPHEDLDRIKGDV